MDQRTDNSTYNRYGAEELEARRRQIASLSERGASRRAELAALKEEAKRRRAEVRQERDRIRIQRSARGFAPASGGLAAAAILEAAVRVAEVDMPELWVDYVAIGGDASPAELTAVLAGHRSLHPSDHDRLVLVLNERLERAGLGRPLAYWDGTR